MFGFAYVFALKNNQITKKMHWTVINCKSFAGGFLLEFPPDPQAPGTGKTQRSCSKILHNVTFWSKRAQILFKACTKLYLIYILLVLNLNACGAAAAFRNRSLFKGK